MNTQEFISNIEEIYEKCMGILKVKNSDYATEDDPFKNFSLLQGQGYRIDEGIVIRMGDKLSRIARLLKKKNLTDGKKNVLSEYHKPAVSDETIEDTLFDMINYSAILLTYLKSNNK